MRILSEWLEEGVRRRRYPLRHAALGAWLAAAMVAALVLDVPLRPPRGRAPDGPVPGLHDATPPMPRSQEPPPPAKSKEKLIEISPWEQVPA